MGGFSPSAGAPDGVGVSSPTQGLEGTQLVPRGPHREAAALCPGRCAEGRRACGRQIVQAGCCLSCSARPGLGGAVPGSRPACDLVWSSWLVAVGLLEVVSRRRAKGWGWGLGVGGGEEACIRPLGLPRLAALGHTPHPQAHSSAPPPPPETGGAGPAGAEHQGAAAAGAPLPEAALGAAVGAEPGARAHRQHGLRRLHRRLRARWAWAGGLAGWQPRGGGGAYSRCGPPGWDEEARPGALRVRDSGGPFGGPAVTRPVRSPQKWTSRAWSLAPASWTVWAAAVMWTTTTACGAAAAATAASGPPAGGPAALASRRRCPPRSSARPPARPSASTLWSLKPLHGPTAVPFWKLRHRPGCPPAGQGPPCRPLLPPGQGPLREAGPSSHIRESSIAAHRVFSDTQSFQKY